ncbi:MAG: type III-A CRISPR-associated protein Csm2 [Ignavibacteriaceae bacterium]|nr:type III-A CRISPR-associated protein Csm2 [Ignavibacteriaceae bacterium]
MSKQYQVNRPQSGGGSLKGKEGPKISDEDLFKQYSIEGFFDSRNVIRTELICDMGDNNVKDLAVRLANGDVAAGDKKLKVNQLRKFYDSYVRIIRADIPEDQMKVQLLMFSANAQYSGDRLKLRLFKLFIKQRVGFVIQSSDDLFKKACDAFKLHFEALVAYFPKNEKEEAE